MNFLAFCFEWSIKIVVFCFVLCFIAFLAIAIVAAIGKILSLLLERLEDFIYERRNQE